ncbi:MAG: hypothetical protein CSA34_02225 [Desulfobulbus propionicus]|nr:MAG: hypothetical protein CSA34_02225 [Desulfobulbus propionicus]
MRIKERLVAEIQDIPKNSLDGCGIRGAQHPALHLLPMVSCLLKNWFLQDPLTDSVAVEKQGSQGHSNLSM